MFSIIIPAYNCEKYIGSAIESVLNQAGFEKEIIIVNDGSTDKTLNICEHYSEKNKCIKLINKNNSGVSETRNIGIKNSSGDYIIFLDADDKLSEGALEKYNSLILENDNPDIILSNFSYLFCDKITKAKNMCDNIFIENKDDFINSIINFYRLKDNVNGNLRTIWAKAFSREIIESIEFNVQLKVGEDMVFFLEAVLNSNRILVSNEVTYLYRVNNESVMHTQKWNGINDNIKYYELVKEISNSCGISDTLFSLWLEISEKEWINLIESDLPFIDKYRFFCRYRKLATYQKYCNLFNKKGFTILERLYLLCIKYRFIIVWMILVDFKIKLR